MPTTPLTYDVVIVGARAAGAATAMLLARHGRRVLVVDRSRYGADTLSTHGLMRAGVLQLHRWGLLDHVVDAGSPPIRRTTFTVAGDRFTIPIKPSHGVDALYAPRRTVLDPILVDAAVAAGAEFRYGLTVTGISRAADGAVSGIVGRDETGSPFAASADLVIGADGARSTIADCVGAPTERVGVAASAVVYGYWSDLDLDGYEWIFANGTAAGIIPTNPGQACIFASASPERMAGGRIDALHEILSGGAPDTAARVRAASAPPGVRTFPGRAGFVRRSWGRGWALVGDAGYWKDPITAHGLSDALRDAELLARAVIDTEGPAERLDAVADYQATRDRLSARLFDVTEAIATFRWTAAEIGNLLLELSASMNDEVDALATLDAVSVP